VDSSSWHTGRPPVPAAAVVDFHAETVRAGVAAVPDAICSGLDLVRRRTTGRQGKLPAQPFLVTSGAPFGAGQAIHGCVNDNAVGDWFLEPWLLPRARDKPQQVTRDHHRQWQEARRVSPRWA
jgi:hypothetical protein